ncbi:histidine phosphatase family protein [Proteinivorax hydrogeniformans]|uniref:Histidine phosphatase family protein n=1 Tax=Proteinivorax hydrogeniformans TaxID=1826727 RepID=A0AAU8HRJ1_9FIRM
MRLILVRHGQTKWNLQKKIQGSTDTELSQQGIEEGRLVAKRLSTWDIDYLYSSDLKRAAKTAQLISEYHPKPLPINYDIRLRESSFGKWEGLTMKQVKEKYLKQYKSREETPHVNIPDGESFKSFSQRLAGFITQKKSQHLNCNIVAVAHSAVIKTILHNYLNLNWTTTKNSIYLSNCSISVLKFLPSKVVLERHNDTAHFENNELKEVPRH